MQKGKTKRVTVIHYRRWGTPPAPGGFGSVVGKRRGGGGEGHFIGEWEKTLSKRGIANTQYVKSEDERVRVGGEKKRDRWDDEEEGGAVGFGGTRARRYLKRRSHAHQGKQEPECSRRRKRRNEEKSRIHGKTLGGGTKGRDCAPASNHGNKKGKKSGKKQKG